MSGTATQSNGTDTQPSYDAPESDTGAPARNDPQQDSDNDQPNPAMRKRLKSSRVLFNEVTADENDRINSSRRASTSQVADDDNPSLGRTTVRGRGTRSRVERRAGITAGRQGRRGGRGRHRALLGNHKLCNPCGFAVKH